MTDINSVHYVASDKDTQMLAEHVTQLLLGRVQFSVVPEDHGGWILSYPVSALIKRQSNERNEDGKNHTS